MVGLMIRDYSPDDIPHLVPIINDEWHFDLYGEDWYDIVVMYIEEYVRRSDVCRVAVLDGKVVGIATARRGEHPVKEDLPPGMTDTEYARDQMVMDEMDARLRSENDLSGLGELVLIIVSADAKGKHVGSALMGDISAYLRSCGCRGMYLSTDTDCNYGFYEHLGYKKIGCGEIVVQRKPIVRMLYRYDFRSFSNASL